ncbi:phosphatidylinositol transfer CSR1 [Pyrenophora seminiperda CCB06]|uniref:Phosphatidylinositol transfer CSR1 n=1 Tax=Pyrenophora seminiperda CCB06 TaxID=1302712 RepID=A0A3M7M766_9PLEO|nr:phosphatidylinositol transfer CSR1 [Pyrenophora seminiperda CCB06]
MFMRPVTRAYILHLSGWNSHHKGSGINFWTVGVVAGVAIGGALLAPLIQTSPGAKPTRSTSAQFDITDLADSYLVMAANTPAGRPGTLTPDQEKKLRELWGIVMRVFGVETASGAEEVTSPAVSEPAAADGKKDKKKSRLNVFKRNKADKATDDKASTTSDSSAPSDIGKLSISADDDKFGQTAEFKAAIANIPPEHLRKTFWSMVKHDHPDALLLRFLRARKWDVEKALVMMISTMQWRLNEMHVDDDIIKNGELEALQNTSGDAKAKKNAEDFLTQLRMGKSYLHGVDVEGRPLCFVRARLHKAGEQTEESLERFTVYTIETARMLLRPPIDTATIVFDMTDFSMANMDYTPVKFMIKCFEANYPESLGTVLVYRAPWVFNAVWSIVKGWLDPVVASKVHFAKTVDELSNYIPRSQIPTEQGGDEKWEYKYPEPVPGENDKMKDEGPKMELQTERQQIVDNYEATVLEWIHDGDSTPLEDKRKERDAIAEQLRLNYWKLDPYVRAKTLYDRMAVIQEGGKLDFYPKASEPAAAVPAKETSADDLD